jgi:hypothetical protein
MTAACHDRGLDTPQFEELGTHFRVTLSATRRHAPAKDEREQAILGALAASSGSGLSTFPDRQANRSVSTRCPNASRVARRARAGSGNRQRTTGPPSSLSSGLRCAVMY